MPDYILEPIETDPDELLDRALDYIQDVFPDWRPSEGQLDWIVLRIISLHQSLSADAATMVMRAIYRYFGATVANIHPLDGSTASVLATFVAMDANGPYTIDDGTVVGIRNLDSQDLILFEVEGDQTIPQGQTQINNVILIAQDEGISGNNLTGLVETIEHYDWLINAFTTSVSSGGIDPESDEDYLNRMTNNFGLIPPRPILAEDFAIMARNVPGVWRAVALDNYIPGANEIQQLSVVGTGGTFTLGYDGNVSNPINYNATIEEVRAAIAPLALYSGDYRLLGGPLPETAVTFEFVGRLGQTDVPTLTIPNNSVTGGAGPIITTTQAASANQEYVANAVAVAAIDIDGNPLNPPLRDALELYLRSLKQQNFIVNVIDPAYSVVDCLATVVKRIGYDDVDVSTRATQAVHDFLLPKNWGNVEWPPDSRGWGQATVLRGQELYTELNNVQGVDWVTDLAFGVNGSGTSDDDDKPLPGVFPLTMPGIVDVQVATI